MTATAQTVATPVPGMDWRRLEGERALDYLLYLPQRRPPQALVVAVHGISRNAREVAESLVPLAERRNIAVVAPLFGKSAYRGYQRLGGNHRPRRAEQALNALLAVVAAETGLATDRVYLYGHSGGGQFVHRYVLLHPGRVIRYVVSAPGWYTLPDRQAAFPYGLRLDGPRPGAAIDLRRVLAVPGCVLVGARDDRRDAALNRAVQIDRAQGRTRIERAETWVTMMNAAARWHRLDTRFTLRLLPGAGHDFTELVTRGGLADAVFDWLSDPAD